MRTIFQLLRLRCLTPYSLLLLYRAKKKHGNNLCFLLKFAADYYGSETAMADENTQLSFKQLYEKVLRLTFVIQRKIQNELNNTAVLICNNSINHILVLYAIQNLGLKLALVNDKLLPGDIFKIIDKQAGACTIFASGSSIENAIDIDDLLTHINGGGKKQYYSKNHARVIFPTSGTTGDIKLIEKKTGEFYWVQSFADLVQRTAIDKRNAAYIAIPVSSGFGYTALLFTLILGKKAVVSGAKNIITVAGFLSQQKVDLLVGVPTVLYKVAQQLELEKHAVISIISSGAALNKTILNKLAGLTTNIFSLYGSTEASTCFIADYTQLSLDSCTLGTPLKGVKYQIQSLLGGGKELLIQSPLANASSGSGWLATGDLVVEDGNGGIIWCSRKDDMIIKMGTNIYPIEIERQLLQIACIEDAYVAGEKDVVKGEIIVAFIKIKPGTSFDEKLVRESLRLVLSGIKVPDEIYIVDYFNYTSTGKKIRPARAISKKE
ncbi:class I adenylate-forming enzyme family protein [Chitinophaga ginsengisoli]|uniref:Acyl-CoA synthetase (AMP-forming)/AMP-acid ligase II n=1 Tax=Chitinophaga ginsengisoli TaxID=363837 RepID=A0A2P8GM21_9BACT|nr:class I adenylate-forming enzyme family protein [Chitinophaga ginsengisoli]PSL35009.1 acyl-CoA synthetase (AMP-forming)/AMP-acid ligase II [Chitinophaga ginsengisoli]